MHPNLVLRFSFLFRKYLLPFHRGFCHLSGSSDFDQDTPFFLLSSFWFNTLFLVFPLFSFSSFSLSFSFSCSEVKLWFFFGSAFGNQFSDFLLLGFVVCVMQTLVCSFFFVQLVPAVVVKGIPWSTSRCVGS